MDTFFPVGPLGQGWILPLQFIRSGRDVYFLYSLFTRAAMNTFFPVGPLGQGWILPLLRIHLGRDKYFLCSLSTIRDKYFSWFTWAAMNTSFPVDSLGQRWKLPFQLIRSGSDEYLLSSYQLGQDEYFPSCLSPRSRDAYFLYSLSTLAGMNTSFAVYLLRQGWILPLQFIFSGKDE